MTTAKRQHIGRHILDAFFIEALGDRVAGIAAARGFMTAMMIAHHEPAFLAEVAVLFRDDSDPKTGPFAATFRQYVERCLKEGYL